MNLLDGNTSDSPVVSDCTACFRKPWRDSAWDTWGWGCHRGHPSCHSPWRCFNPKDQGLNRKYAVGIQNWANSIPSWIPPKSSSYHIKSSTESGFFRDYFPAFLRDYMSHAPSLADLPRLFSCGSTRCARIRPFLQGRPKAGKRHRLALPSTVPSS